jgi:hypothetical protein
MVVNEKKTNADIQAPGSDRHHPLPVLRTPLRPPHPDTPRSPRSPRVNKYFSNLAAQVFFRTLDLSNLHLNQLQRRLQDAPNLGLHIRTLLLHPQDDQHVPTAHRLDPCIIELLNHMPNIRKLIIYYHQNDYYGHPQLLQALSNLPHLDSIETRDALLKPDADSAEYGETTQTVVSKTWWNRLVQHFLDNYPSRLRSVRLYGTLPLHLAAFCKIRDRLPALERLELTMSIGLDLRDAFAYQTRWKSSPTLTTLVLRQCTGVHVTVVANHIASGVFGNLAFLTLTMCGHASDDPDLELPPHNDHSGWRIPTMQRVEIDHADHWRVAALARLHVRELVLSRVPRKTQLLVAQRDRLFPGLETLSISPPPPPTPTPMQQQHESEFLSFFGEVSKAAAKRGIITVTVTEDVPFRGNCACHRE